MMASALLTLCASFLFRLLTRAERVTLLIILSLRAQPTVRPYSGPEERPPTAQAALSVILFRLPALASGAAAGALSCRIFDHDGQRFTQVREPLPLHRPDRVPGIMCLDKDHALIRLVSKALHDLHLREVGKLVMVVVGQALILGDIHVKASAPGRVPIALLVSHGEDQRNNLGGRIRVRRQESAIGWKRGKFKPRRQTRGRKVPAPLAQLAQGSPQIRLARLILIVAGIDVVITQAAQNHENEFV